MSDSTNRDKERVSGQDDVTLDLNFVPQWARRPPDAVRFARFDDADHASRRDGGHQDRSRGARSRDRDQNRSRQKMRAEERDHAQSPKRGKRLREDRAGHPSAPTDRRGTDVAQHGRGHGRPVPEKPVVEVLPLNVRFLPEQKALSDLIRRVSASLRAYPLLDLASLLMSKEGLCYVKLEVKPEARTLRLFQCKHCGTLARTADAIENHVVESHVDRFFDIKEEEVEPPSGVFVCVAKCGLSGELLGPPNHHSYAEAVKRVHAERFSNMDIEAYRRRIQTSHDEADVERWKQEASKRMIYRLKQDGKNSTDEHEGGDQASAPQSWSDAQRYMRTVVAPRSVESSRRVALEEKVAHGLQDPAIRGMLREEWQQESRFPIHLAFALRAAFRHRGLHLFKTRGEGGKGINFVTAVKPSPIDPETTIPAIRDALLFMKDHPGCTRKDMVEALLPDEPPESDAVKALLQPIHWLVEKGHVIEFFNGTLSVPKMSQR